MKQREGFDPGRPVILTVFFLALMALPLGLAGCGKQITRMEDNQVKLQAMVAANARQLATLSSQLHANQGHMQESLQKLDQNLTEKAAAVQNEQVRLHQALTSGNQTLNKRMTQLEENQQLLQDGVAQVASVTQRTASDVTAIAREHATLHRMVQNNKQELAANITTVADNQQKIQTGIGHLQQADLRMSEHLATMAGKQETLHKAIQDGNEQLAGRLTTLATVQTQIYDDFDGLRTLTQTVAEDVTGISRQQTVLCQTLNDRADTLAAKIAIVEQNQDNMQSLIDRVANTTSGTATDITAVANAQSAQRETLEANHRVIAGQLAAMSQNQQDVQADVATLDEKADQTGTTLTGLVAGQDALHEQVKTGQNTLAAQVTTVTKDQQALETGIQGLGEKTDRVAADVTAVAATQDALRQGLQGHNEAVHEQMAILVNNQQGLQTGLDTVTATAGQTALDVMAMDNRQAKLGQAVQAGISNLNDMTNHVTADLDAAAAEQVALRESVTTGNDSLTAQITALSENQQVVQTGVNGLRQRADQTAADVVTVATGQDALQQTMTGYGKAIDTRLTHLAESQQGLRSDLDVLTATTGQAALDVIAMGETQSNVERAVTGSIGGLREQANGVAAGLDAVAAKQTSLHEILKRHDETVSGQIADVANSQQQVRSGLDTVTATAGQTALDVIAMTARQDALHQSLQSHDEAVGSQMANIADRDQTMQANLDTVTATTSQAALDLIGVSDRQANMEQAAQANRLLLDARLAEITQGQQQWLQRFDAAQTNMDTMDAGIVTLEQDVTKLQATLQASLDGLTALLDTKGQERLQFDAAIDQGMQAMVDSVSELRQTQASLREQMQQMQSSTQNQTEDIISAIEQLRQPPSELTVSNASTELKSSVAEGAK